MPTAAKAPPAAKAPRLTQRHINSLAEGLAEKAGITVDQAHSVLKVMHIHKLEENLQAYHAIMSDQKSVNALGLSQNFAKEALRVARPDTVTVANLRIAIKPSLAASVAV